MLNQQSTHRANTKHNQDAAHNMLWRRLVVAVGGVESSSGGGGGRGGSGDAVGAAAYNLCRTPFSV